MQQNDPDLQIIIDYLLFRKLPDDDKLARQVTIESNDYIVDNDILYHLYYPRGKGHRVDRMVKQLVIPLSLRNDIMLAYHDALTGGHLSIHQTKIFLDNYVQRYSVLCQIMFIMSKIKALDSQKQSTSYTYTYRRCTWSLAYGFSWSI